MLNSRHLSYSDFQLWVDMLGLRNKTAVLEIGLINAIRTTAIERVYVRIFFDWMLRGKKESTLFEGPSKDYQRWCSQTLVVRLHKIISYHRL
jgi:hypothetical protein